MGRNKKADILRVARAREACWKNRLKTPEENIDVDLSEQDCVEAIDDIISIDTSPSPPPGPPLKPIQFDPESKFEELEGEELLESLCVHGEHELALERKFYMAFDLLKPRTKKDWMSMKKNRSLGYNGLSVRTHQ